MRHYIGIVHKEPASSFGVHFPDLPGVISSGKTIDDAILNAAEVLAFAAEDWEELTGQPFPQPRSFDELRNDPDMLARDTDSIIAAIPFRDGQMTSAAA
jgi:antitoxin HicB